MASDQRSAICPLALFCCYLTNPLQKWSLDSIPLCLILDEPFLWWFFFPPLFLDISISTTSEPRPSNTLPAAATAAWPTHKEAKPWLMKALNRSSCGMNTNPEKAVRHTYWTWRGLLFTFCSCFLIKMRKKTESHTSEGAVPSSPAMLWLLHYPSGVVFNQERRDKCKKLNSETN